MSERRGERIGWIGGWSGGFIWLFILSVIWLIQARYAASILGFALFVAALVSIVSMAPWRHPRTPYWKLFLPIYGVLGLAIAAAIWGAGGPEKLGLNAWSLPLVLVLLIPFVTAGKQCWNDRQTPVPRP